MVDNKKANESIHKTDSLASKLGKGLGNGIKTAAKWGAAISAGAVAGGAALLGVAKNAADTGDRVDKLSQKIGLSRQGFQEWEYILSQNGTSIEVLQGGMKKMNKTLDDAKSGNEKAAATFARVGLSLSEIKDMNPEQAFEATVKALQGMPEGAEKAALANELLGRSGSELMPLLNGSAESVEELKKQAHDLGIVLSDDAVDASALFTDTLDNLQRSFGAVVAKVGVAVMPIMQQFADWILVNMPTIQRVMGIVFNAIQVAVTTVVKVFQDYFLPVLASVVNWVKENWDDISATVKFVFDLVKSAVTFISGIFKNYLIPAFKAVVDWVRNNWDEISRIIKHVFESVKNIVRSALEIVKSIIKTVTSIIRGDWRGAWDGIKSIFSNTWDAIKSITKLAVDAVKTIVSGAWESIRSTTTRIWNGIKDAIMKPINAAKDAVKNAIDSIKNMFNFEFKWPKLKMPKFSIKGSMNPLKWLKEGVPKLSVDWYAKGGIFDKPTLFSTPYGLKGVGEKGPEAVAPISRLQEMIDWNAGNDPAQMNSIIELLKIIAGKSNEIIINGKVLAKEISPDVNKQLNLIKQRG